MIKKKKWWLIICLLILFITLSSYRYYVINNFYKKYEVVVLHKKSGDSFRTLNLEHTLGKPTRVETVDNMKNKVTEYHIPIRFKNPTNYTIKLQPEFYKMIREDRIMQTLDFINDKTQKRILEFQPGEEIISTVKFSYIEVAGKEDEKNKAALLNIVSNDGKKGQKIEIPIY
ncbi:hypothetical protein CN520_24475 [Bacillus cereus]|uniref:hypothetical protein n=1 Tax=Bacillus cereus TaxID=1396 RepID=UPI000BF92E3B|nr:hypothetical protein [Bacillus cereus]PET37898.1 hypothetical protein CN520_24475 [Bacillus cereus]PEY79066.1 hypothetical protein CN344_10490 [Bacillus cereus]PFW12847.1 hypothetical protein COL12_03065 [Bacillus cereus]PGP76269.1 hypothetical protein CN999_28120 [Bacillus cereus]